MMSVWRYSRHCKGFPNSTCIWPRRNTTMPDPHTVWPLAHLIGCSNYTCPKSKVESTWIHLHPVTCGEILIGRSHHTCPELKVQFTWIHLHPVPCLLQPRLQQHALPPLRAGPPLQAAGHRPAPVGDGPPVLPDGGRTHILPLPQRPASNQQPLGQVLLWTLG